MALGVAEWLGICITSFSVFSFAVYLAAMGWCVVCMDWCTVVDSHWALEQMRRASAWCRKALLTWQGSCESHIDAAVHNLVQQRKRDFTRSALMVLSPVFALGDFFVIGRTLGLFQVEQAEDPSSTHLLVSAAARVVTALCIFRKDQPTKGIWMACHIVAFGSLLLKLHSCNTALDMLSDRSALGIRVAFVLSLCDVRLTVLCNSLYSAFMMYKLKDFALKDEDFAQLGVNRQLYQEIVIFSGCVACHVVFSWRLETEARATIDAKVSTKFIAGLRKLLKTSYDVVVELDDQLMLTDDAKDLAGVLLHGPHRSLKGSPIIDLMVDDADKEAFSTHVPMQSLDAGSQCCAIPHVFHMRDSCRNLLCMEMWHTRFEDLDSRPRHLIGIKELGNNEHTPNMSAPTEMPLITFERKPPKTPRGRRSTSGVDVSDEEQPRQGQIVQNAQQEHAPQGHVRPQDPANGGEDSDGSSVSQAPAERPKKCMVEGFRLTSAQARSASILHTLTAWNVELRPAGCCSYHDLIKEAMETGKRLENANCQQVDSIHSEAELWQCPTCGILALSAANAAYDVSAGVCYLCRDFRNATSQLVQL